MIQARRARHRSHALVGRLFGLLAVVGVLCISGCSSLPTIVPDLAPPRKLLIVDGPAAFLGGINISAVYSGGSFSQKGDPLAAKNLGAEFGKEVQAMFDKDLAASDAITLEQWERRPLDVRIKELMSRVSEYWL